jgi:hypothetical protein
MHDLIIGFACVYSSLDLFKHFTKFRFIWPSGFRGKDFFKLANQKQELPVATMFVNGSGQNEQSL